MHNIQVLRLLDDIAKDANALWHKAERAKMAVADQLNVTAEQMKRHGIYVDDGSIPERKEQEL